MRILRENEIVIDQPASEASALLAIEESERMQDLTSETKAEGIAADTQGHLWYVMDDDRIRLKRVRP